MLKKTAAALLAVLMLITLCSCSGSWKNDYEDLLDKAVGKVDLNMELESADTETQLRERLNIGESVVVVLRKEEIRSVGVYDFGSVPFSAFFKLRGIVFVHIPKHAVHIFRARFAHKSKGFIGSVSTHI